ncbi:hypothetical protein EP47_13090, partial [Legionella norrlandica]
MKVLSKLAFANVFCFTALSVSAQTYDQYQYTQQTSTNTSNLVTYLTNLGKYLGYDITDSKKTPSPPWSELLNKNAAQLIQNYAYYTVLGAIPVNAMSQGLMNFVTSGVEGNRVINSTANNTFKIQNYDSGSSGQSGKVTANSSIDQSITATQTTGGSGIFTTLQPQAAEKFLKDPVSQAVYNILGTPSYTYCMANDEKSYLSNCNLKSDNMVMQNAVGTLPPADQLYKFGYNQLLVSDLNSNSLIAPLVLDTSATLSQAQSSDTTPGGLKAVSQAQIAANFIKYASA